MKKYALIIVLFANSAIAQQSLDTIFANDKKNVALFFPEPIRQGITGTSSFVFTYNREKEQYFGLLQATPGTESNLLAVTKDGRVYSYILKFKEQLPKLNYFISEKESIGSERPNEANLKVVSQVQNQYENTVAYFQRFSKYLLKSNYDPVATKRKRGIKLQLQKMAYNGSEVYLLMEIKNKSEINFEIDYLKVFIANGNKKRKASFQRLEQKLVCQYGLPDEVKIGERKRFVFVFPKFVLGDNEKLMLELREKKGGRKVVLSTRL